MNFLVPSGRRSFASFLARSLLVVEREHPRIYVQLALAVRALSVLCEVDGEQISIQSDGERLGLRPLSAAQEMELGSVQLRTTRRVIRQLLQGKLTLEGAVWDDDVFLRGELEQVLAFYDGLQFYFAAAVRAPTFPFLLREFLDGREAEDTADPSEK